LIAKLGCIPCIIDDLYGAMESLELDEDIKRQIMKECLEFLAKTDFDREPSAYITEVHRILKRISGIKVPFAQRRLLCNQMGFELEKKLKPKIQNLAGLEKFSMLVRWSIAGNALDFRTVGTGYEFDIDAMERSLHKIADSLEVDQLNQIYDKVKSAKKILFIHDNVGEIVLDKMLIGCIKEESGGIVVSVVRGGPITSDATMDDAEQVELSEAATEVILAGPDTLGISFEEMSSELRNEMSKADIIFAKGQANFYVFSKHKDEVKCPVVCLLRTKCKYISGIFNYDDNINIATIL
jgi:uncharacterized protein with ATP-grasp and redox domains